MANHALDVASGNRFEFGQNWSRFLGVLDEKRIDLAAASLCQMLERPSLNGLSFLDIGSGSGLFSLAARRLGARVHSFDFDPASVACTRELRRRYFPDDADWNIDEASVLDRRYLSRLGTFDVVYSWGVLHHTGAMWDAFANLPDLVRPTGSLFLAIYNDQGGASRRWRWIKRTYNRLPGWLRGPFALAVLLPRELRILLATTAGGRPGAYFDNIRHYADRSLRGMSYWHDLIDWIGGYPFEVATPEQVFDFFRDRQFVLRRLKTCAGNSGCNEFVFQRQA